MTTCAVCLEPLGDAKCGVACSVCDRKIHAKPCSGDVVLRVFAGDYFYRYECAACAPPIGSYARFSISWVDLIRLALFNLLTDRGATDDPPTVYVRWREDICEWIDNYWDIVTPGKVRTSTWSNTVASSLSQKASRYFASGTATHGSSGWWTLRTFKPPDRPASARLIVASGSNDHTRSAIDHAVGHETTPSNNAKRKSSREGLTETHDRSQMIDSDVSLPKKCAGCSKSDATITRALPLDVRPSLAGQLASLCHSCDAKFTKNHYCPVCAMTYNPRSRQPMVMCDDCERWVHIACANISLDMYRSMAPSSDTDDTVANGQPFSCSVCTDRESRPQEKYRLLKKNSRQEGGAHEHIEIEGDLGRSNKRLRAHTSMNDESLVDAGKTVSLPPRPLTDQDVAEIIAQLRPAVNVNHVPALARLLRKLLLRQLKRNLKLPLFDLDETTRKSITSSSPSLVLTHTDAQTTPGPTAKHRSQRPQHRGDLRRELDRYQAGNLKLAPVAMDNTPITRPCDAFEVPFHRRLLGADADEAQTLVNLTAGEMVSPYTFRRLKPYIRRDFFSHPEEPMPAKLALLRSIQSSGVLYPLDYCYFRPEHVGQVNTFLRTFFWPGINMQDALDYPDFSVVVCYKRLVVACAFMTPGAYISYVLVHPDWRNAGIATFMVYHLLQTCQGKDVTLHASANNPAMFLYQRFGFKPEEFIVDFYDKYYPSDSVESKNAFFIRLRR